VPSILMTKTSSLQSIREPQRSIEQFEIKPRNSLRSKQLRTSSARTHAAILNRKVHSTKLLPPRATSQKSVRFENTNVLPDKAFFEDTSDHSPGSDTDSFDNDPMLHSRVISDYGLDATGSNTDYFPDSLDSDVVQNWEKAGPPAVDVGIDLLKTLGISYHPLFQEIREVKPAIPITNEKTQNVFSELDSELSLS
jgi:hypothetical protein